MLRHRIWSVVESRVLSAAVGPGEVLVEESCGLGFVALEQVPYRSTMKVLEWPT